MTGHVIDIILLRQFYIIIHPEIDLSFIIYYLTYRTFFVNLPNEPFDQFTQSIFLINQHIIDLVAVLACGMFFLFIYIHIKVYSYLLSYI